MLFLFDIDGTLLRRMPPFHSNAIRQAAEKVYGVRIGHEDLGPTAGMTDTTIARRLLTHAGVPGDEQDAGLPAFFDVAAALYDRLVADTDLSGYRTPYAAETLAWLAEAGASLGLVTGNVQRIAWRKLAAAGLASHFACGGFGDEAESRDDLPPIALARAEAAFERAFAPTEVFVVGDTPLDVACGAAHGLRTVGVATGPLHSVADLEACGADYAVADLRGLYELDLALEGQHREG